MTQSNPSTSPQTSAADHQVLMQSALVELRQMRTQLAQFKARAASQTEPIAVVGIGCRFPGGVNSPDTFWQLLKNGVNAISEVPADRWSLADYYDPNPDAPGKISTRYGGFVDRLADFDAAFFGIADREAKTLDPQQRLLLEVSWETFENAGLLPQTYQKTGVFVGISSNDYSQHLLTRPSTEVDAYLATGNSHSTAAGRLSYVFGFTGPSLAVDTACSSSLVAVDLACQNLRSKTCDLALAGGVNRIISPEFSINFSKARMLAADGRCKTFDASADGFGRAEGCGMILLKRLSDAVAQGDRIFALIRGSAVNQDGHSSGLTVPNGPAQQAVIQQALTNSQIQPAQISYIEAHGTGTALGDPIEVNALAAVFESSHSVDSPLYVGSVKTNLGHLEAAAGIAGLIKVILSLHHRAIPAHLHFQRPNPHLNWQDLPLVIPTTYTDWIIPQDSAPEATVKGTDSSSSTPLRCAGVSSFGFSGTNAHIILEESPIQISDVGACKSSENTNGKLTSKLANLSTSLSTNLPANDRPLHLLTLSAKTAVALQELVARYRQHLVSYPDLHWADVCYSASTHRTHFPVRLGFVAGSTSEAVEKLAGFTTEQFEDATGGIITGEIVTGEITTRQASASPSIGLQFAAASTFQCEGAWQLYQTHPRFRQSVDQCADCCTELFGIEISLLEIPSSTSNSKECNPGDPGLSLTTSSIPSQSAYLTLFAIEYALAQLWLEWGIQPDGVSGQGIGAFVAGCLAGVFDLRDALKLTDALRLSVMNPQAIEQVAHRIPYQLPSLPMESNLTGKLNSAYIITPAYWCQQAIQSNLINTVFYDVIISINPASDWRSLLSTLAHVYVQGVAIDWQRFDQHYARQFVTLPTYPFQYQRYWIDRVPVPYSAPSPIQPALHPLLGHPLSLSRTAVLYFESQLAAVQPAFLQQHRVLGAVILPAAGYIELILAAGQHVFQTTQLTLTHLCIIEPLRLSEQPHKIQCLFISDPESHPDPQPNVEVLSQTPDHTWLLHATGTLQPTLPSAESIESIKSQSPELELVQLNQCQDSCTQAVNLTDYYREFAAYGIEYGVDFQILQSLWQGEGQALGEIQLPVTLSAQPYCLHPVLLDAAFQVIGAALSQTPASTYLPIGCHRLICYQSAGSRLWSYVRHRSAQSSDQQPSDRQPSDHLFDLTLFTPEGDVIALIEGLQLHPVEALSEIRFRQISDHLSGHSKNHKNDQQSIQDWFYQVEWQPHPLSISTSLALPTPQTIQEKLSNSITDAFNQPKLLRYQDHLNQLEQLSLGYILNSFAELNWQPTLGEFFTTTELAHQLGVVETHQSLLHRLLEILAEESLLQRTSSHWQTLQPLPDGSALLTLPDLATSPATSIELALLERCGTQLAKLLQGKVQPLSLLFPADPKAGSVAQLYRDSVGAKQMNQTLQQVLHLALAPLVVAPSVPTLPHQHQSRKLRILEVGAGTGGTTAYLLDELADLDIHYTFTDVSSLFLSQAQAVFKAYSQIEYRILDLEQPPALQGFELHQYDIIIAANVIHATADSQQSLQYIHQLLTSDGLLLLLEGIRPLRWLDLIFGLTPGWWHFRDRDLRPSYPLMPIQQWQQVLQTSGFSSVVITPDSAAQAVLVAQVQLVPEENSPSGVDLILSDRQGVGQQLATALRTQGRTVVEVPPTATHPASFPELQPLTEILRDCAVHLRVVYLWGLDLPAAGTADLLETIPQSCVKLLDWVGFLDRPAALWIVTQQAVSVAGEPIPGIAQIPLWGIGKVINLERPEWKCRHVDLNVNLNASLKENLKQNCELDLSESVVKGVEQLLKELNADVFEEQVALRQGERYVARLKQVEQLRLQSSDCLSSSSLSSSCLSSSLLSSNSLLSLPSDQPFRLDSTQRGTLENLILQPTSRRTPRPNEVEIRVWTTGLNLIDVLDALGVLPFTRDGFGVECAGEIVAVGSAVDSFQIGDAVIALAPQSFGQYVTIAALLVAPMPNHLSYEAAATIPANFLTANYALRQVAQLDRGERVLIHAAATGTGMAAVQIAQRLGAEVFATASPAKWEALRNMGVHRLMNSRTLDFAEEVMRKTQGAGVEVVLNSLTGDFIPKSLSVLAPHGRFLEIGKRGVWSLEQVQELRPDITYEWLDLMGLAQQQPEQIQTQLHHLIAEFEAGILQPLPYQTYGIEQVIPAFRQMQQAKHVGKIVVSQAIVTSQEITASQVERPQQWRICLHSTYLITGGLGGLGWLTAEWLVSQGALHLVLVSRHLPNAVMQLKIHALEQQGVQVIVAQADVAQVSQLASVISQIQQSQSPLKGVFHAAGVLDDGLVQHLNSQRFKTVMAAKIAGGWNLHQLTQDLPLDYFVLFSSAAALLGSPGQANHVAANLFLDALAQHRQAMGQPGISINWGVWSEVGSALSRVEQMQARGMRSITPSLGLQSLEQSLSMALPQIGVMPVDWELLRQQGIQSPFLANFLTAVSAEVALAIPTAQSPILQELTSAADRFSGLVSYLQMEVGRVLGLPPTRLPKPRQGFFDLGLDSLMAVELKHRLETQLAVRLSSTVIFEHPTIYDLAHHLLDEHLNFPESSLSKPPQAVIGAPINQPMDESTGKLKDKLREQPEDEQISEPIDKSIDQPIDAAIMTELLELETLLKRN